MKVAAIQPMTDFGDIGRRHRNLAAEADTFNKATDEKLVVIGRESASQTRYGE
jgi:hypothetical protein